MSKKLIVLSIDAMQVDDMDKILKKPFMSTYKDKMAIVRNIREIYPTLTYPIHTTMVTGVTPNKHGIFHNQKPTVLAQDPDWSLMGSDWFWQEENIQVKTLQDYCEEKGLVVASVGWPVTANDKRGINIPEIWPPKNRSDLARDIFKETSSSYAFDTYYDRYITHFNWKDNEDLSLYNCEMMLDILKNDKPDVLLGHILHFDHTRHVYGVNSPQIDDCVRQMDVLLKRFIDCIEENYDMDNTTIVFVSDHGQLDIKRHVYLNKLFEDEGLIRFNGDEIDYDAYSFTAGFSTQIYLKEDNAEIREKVHAILVKAMSDYPRYLERLYTKEEVNREEGLSGPFDFVIEGTKGTLFRNELHMASMTVDMHDSYRYHGMHGHHPSKGLKPCMMVLGSMIEENKVIEQADMVDVFPTLMKFLDIDVENIDGKAVDIFKG